LGTVSIELLRPPATTDVERAARYAEGVEILLESGNVRAALWLAVRAFALDPINPGVMVALVTAAQAHLMLRPPGAGPGVHAEESVYDGLGARRFITAARLADLVADESLLEAYCQVFSAESDATLVILTGDAEAESAEVASGLLSKASGAPESWPDVHLLTDRSALMIARSQREANCTLASEGVRAVADPERLRLLSDLVWTAYATDVDLPVPDSLMAPVPGS
jgi:hypothetical protein